jgi:DNA-binding NtrC family response regulator
LFGHEKGSFTGATEARKGYFEEADGGTIFLDEVGELPLSTQVRLLRVLQSGEFIRVGSAKVQKTNVRVVAATNNDLLQAIESGRFREDLYYRLNTVPISVPPLRERVEDIPLLFRKFAADVAVQYKMPAIQLDEGAKALLQSHYWRGNVRQLKNVAEQISALEKNRVVTADVLATYLSPVHTTTSAMSIGKSSSDEFSTERELLYKILFDMRSDINDLKRMLSELMHGSHPMPQQQKSEVIGLLPSPIVSHHQTGVVSHPASVVPSVDSAADYAESEVVVDEVPAKGQTKADMQREQILRALKNNNGRRRDAARELFLSERTLYRRIKELGISDDDI